VNNDNGGRGYEAAAMLADDVFNGARVNTRFAWRDAAAYRPTDDQCARIAALNDQARAAIGIDCTLAATSGFLKLSEGDQECVRALVQSYDAWNIGIDIYDERDFGIVFQLADGRWTTDTPDGSGWLGAVFWKINYFDKAFDHPSKRPWDQDVTARILTLMRPDEY
jgi:hypothetical protein